jgi:hypothetical protein
MQLERAGQRRIHRRLDTLQNAVVHDFPDAEHLVADHFIRIPVALFVLVHHLSNGQVVLVAQRQQAVRITERKPRLLLGAAAGTDCFGVDCYRRDRRKDAWHALTSFK